MTKGVSMSIKERVLEEATSLIEGKRQQEYGTPFDNYSRVAALWSLLIGKTITAQQAALMMAALKMDRAFSNPEHRDSYVDLCGYTAIARECAVLEHTYAMAEKVSK